MNKYLPIFSLLLAFLAFFGCEKDTIPLPNQLLGDWEFKVDRTEFNTDSIGYFFHDSLVYLGKIKYGSNSNEIVIEYSSENDILLDIDADNKLSNFPTYYCGGEFIGEDKIHLYLRWGGIGGGVTHVVDGVKQ